MSNLERLMANQGFLAFNRKNVATFYHSLRTSFESMFIPEKHIVYIENYEYGNERGLCG